MFSGIPVSRYDLKTNGSRKANPSDTEQTSCREFCGLTNSGQEDFNTVRPSFRCWADTSDSVCILRIDLSFAADDVCFFLYVGVLRGVEEEGMKEEREKTWVWPLEASYRRDPRDLYPGPVCCAPSFIHALTQLQGLLQLETQKPVTLVFWTGWPTSVKYPQTSAQFCNS